MCMCMCIYIYIYIYMYIYIWVYISTYVSNDIHLRCVRFIHRFDLELY